MLILSFCIIRLSKTSYSERRLVFRRGRSVGWYNDGVHWCSFICLYLYINLILGCVFRTKNRPRPYGHTKINRATDSQTKKWSQKGTTLSTKVNPSNISMTSSNGCCVFLQLKETLSIYFKRGYFEKYVTEAFKK